MDDKLIPTLVLPGDEEEAQPVSYTHLDVYKRQGFPASSGSGGWTSASVRI